MLLLLLFCSWRTLAIDKLAKLSIVYKDTPVTRENGYVCVMDLGSGGDAPGRGKMLMPKKKRDNNVSMKSYCRYKLYSSHGQMIQPYIPTTPYTFKLILCFPYLTFTI